MFIDECKVYNNIQRRSPVSFRTCFFFYIVFALWSILKHTPIEYRGPIKKRNQRPRTQESLRALGPVDPWHTNDVIGWEGGDIPSSLYTRPRRHEGPKMFGWMKQSKWLLAWHQVDNVSWSTRCCVKIPSKKSGSNTKLRTLESN